MNIIPYTSVDSLLFGESTINDCIKLYGEPERTSVKRYGIKEYRYKGFIMRFEPEKGSLRECTLLPYSKAVFSDLPVTWDTSFLRQACAMDSAPVDIFGFIVLRDIGLAVTGIHDGDTGQLAVTAFSRGDFDDLMGDAKPFTID
ncbi:MAG: hypothetical protein JXR97_02080 [Planctomycetes bacterium]|nr:hypothetical protein [Planctomycetota bacterium]